VVNAQICSGGAQDGAQEQPVSWMSRLGAESVRFQWFERFADALTLFSVFRWKKSRVSLETGHGLLVNG